MNPNLIASSRQAAETFLRSGRIPEAEAALEKWLAIEPDSEIARFNYAAVLLRQRKIISALYEIKTLVRKSPQNPSFTSLLANILAEIGEFEHALQLHANLAKQDGSNPVHWLGLGHAHKALGNAIAAISAYRRALAVSPTFAAAYWAIANLKTEAITSLELEKMKSLLRHNTVNKQDAAMLNFAIGKALEDSKDYESSFFHYQYGCKIIRSISNFNIENINKIVERSFVLFSNEFAKSRGEKGTDANSPIFIVGLPRSGSTLVEQILASHSLVEGTTELPELEIIARQIETESLSGGLNSYPECLGNLSSAQLKSFGDMYITRTRLYRRTSKPRFIDKMPNNFLHIGLIQMILPDAKIIDVRRDPVASCFSAYKQYFAEGQHYSYDFFDLASYYGNYTKLTKHFDGIFPGKIHRISYEDLVLRPKETIVKLLGYCELPFETECLEFYRSQRSVATPSAQQVRQPIYKSSLDNWRNYEQWLEPLKLALARELP